MKVLTISDVRRNLAAVVDAVIDDAEECVIPRGGGRAVVMVSLDEWNAMRETLHALGSADNARRLLDSIAQADAGLIEEHPLADDEEPRPDTDESRPNDDGPRPDAGRALPGAGRSRPGTGREVA